MFLSFSLSSILFMKIMQFFELRFDTCVQMVIFMMVIQNVFRANHLGLFENRLGHRVLDEGSFMNLVNFLCWFSNFVLHLKVLLDGYFSWSFLNFVPNRFHNFWLSVNMLVSLKFQLFFFFSMRFFGRLWSHFLGNLWRFWFSLRFLMSLNFLNIHFFIFFLLTLLMFMVRASQNLIIFLSTFGIFLLIVVLLMRRFDLVVLFAKSALFMGRDLGSVVRLTASNLRVIGIG